MPTGGAGEPCQRLTAGLQHGDERQIVIRCMHTLAQSLFLFHGAWRRDRLMSNRQDNDHADDGGLLNKRTSDIVIQVHRASACEAMQTSILIKQFFLSTRLSF